MPIRAAPIHTPHAVVDPSPILFLIGVILIFFGLAMLLPAAVDLHDGNDDYLVFVACSAISVFLGAVMTATGHGRRAKMNAREVILGVPLTWICMAVFGALPFMFSALKLSFTDAFFETMSGLTATGSTVIVGLDTAPKGLLMWRFLIVWLGGFGVVTFALLVLPFLRIGGMQLFSLDLSAQSGRFLPRMATVIARIAVVYLTLTVLCASAFRLQGMSGFDAVGHAMATVATGGFSAHDANFGFFKSAGIEYTASVFMLISAMPFIVHLQVIRGNLRALFRDEQVRLFIGIVVVSIMMVTAWLVLAHGLSLQEALRGATFNVSALITCTGFTSQDFSPWGGGVLVLFLTLMLMGGCTGSTAGGIKMFRLCILAQNVRIQINRQIYPHVTNAVLYNGEQVSDSVRAGVVNYFFVYIASFAILSLSLGFAGLSVEESTSAAATALGGVGPGFGPVIGPCCTFQPVSDAAKWLLSFGMLAGRLEIIILFLPLTAFYWRG